LSKRRTRFCFSGSDNSSWFYFFEIRKNNFYNFWPLDQKNRTLFSTQIDNTVVEGKKKKCLRSSKFLSAPIFLNFMASETPWKKTYILQPNLWSINKIEWFKNYDSECVIIFIFFQIDTELRLLFINCSNHSFFSNLFGKLRNGVGSLTMGCFDNLIIFK
jgi:hypothetical protein